MTITCHLINNYVSTGNNITHIYPGRYNYISWIHTHLLVLRDDKYNIQDGARDLRGNKNWSFDKTV